MTAINNLNGLKYLQGERSNLHMVFISGNLLRAAVSMKTAPYIEIPCWIFHLFGTQEKKPLVWDWFIKYLIHCCLKEKHTIFQLTRSRDSFPPPMVRNQPIVHFASVGKMGMLGTFWGSVDWRNCWENWRVLMHLEDTHSHNKSRKTPLLNLYDMPTPFQLEVLLLNSVAVVGYGGTYL